MTKPATDKAAIMRQAQAQPATEATQIEQSRAIAQVQGALVVAQQRPRDPLAAQQRIREACGIPALAERAFFKFDRGGQSVTGPSIHLATELARCWGNVDYGIVELRRDDEKRESEMLAVAWDLETNTRVANSFIVPHKRDKRGGPVALVDLRDIYENNANAAARRLRECIFRIVPVYVLEDAKALCMATLQHGGGEPIAVRAEKLLKAFGDIGVTRQQIEKRIGSAIARITPVDIANLGIVYKSIERGEVQAADEFPSLAAAEITGALKGEPPLNESPKDNAASDKGADVKPPNGGDRIRDDEHPGTPVDPDQSREPAGDLLDRGEPPASKHAAETAAASTASGSSGHQTDETEWAEAVPAMLDRIDAATSIADLDVIVASNRIKPDLDKMATAAPQQHRAVTGFIAEKRKELGG